MSDPNPSPQITSFTGQAGDDGEASDSLQAEINTPVKLSWTIEGADSVELTDPAKGAPQSLDGTDATVTPGQDTQVYSLVAISGDVRSATATVTVATHAAGAVVSPHAIVSSDGPPRVYTPKEVPAPPASWPGVDPNLANSRIVQFDGNPISALPKWLNGEADIDNTQAIESFKQQLANEYEEREFWMVLVPGTSEVAAPGSKDHHHTMYVPRGDDDPKVDVISPEFRCRLDHAYTMLQRDAVRFIVISGGAIDQLHPEYVEAKRGRTYLIGKYANGDESSDLWSKIIVDPWAVHSEMNLRNGAAIAALMGLDRTLVVTTYKTFNPADQGYMFEHMHNYPMGFAHADTIDGFCDSGIGYRLGDIKRLPKGPDHLFDNRGTHIAFPSVAFVLYGFPAADLVADDHWSVGKLELASGKLHGIKPLTDDEYQQVIAPGSGDQQV